jgi:two-component system nitrate/nitrite response regulator NarL
MESAKRKGRRENASGHLRVTKREREILHLLVDGRTNREIAKALGIQEQTVKNALSVLCEKCDVRNRVQLAVAAVRSLREDGQV